MSEKVSVVDKDKIRALVEGRDPRMSDEEVNRIMAFFEELREKSSVLGPMFELLTKECRRQIYNLETLMFVRMNLGKRGLEHEPDRDEERS